MKIKSKNHLKEPERSNTSDHIFTTCSHVPEIQEHLKQAIKTFPRWAYIDHLPDSDDGSPHTHFYLETSGSYKLKTIANRLGIDNNYVQFVDNPRTIKRYFLHLDNPEKKQYLLSDIITNIPAQFKCATIDNSDDDVMRLFADLDKLRRGSISRDEFVSLHFPEIQKMPFINKIKTYEIINKYAGGPHT